MLIRSIITISLMKAVDGLFRKWHSLKTPLYLRTEEVLFLKNKFIKDTRYATKFEYLKKL